MYYMDDEDYFEPGEFDEKIEELKNELREHVLNSSTFSSIITLGLTSPAHLQATQARPRMNLSFGFPPLALLKCLQSGENHASPTGCPSQAFTGSTCQTSSQ